MKATNQTSVPAVTITYNDLKHLVTRIVDYLKEKKITITKSVVSFYGESYNEEFQYDKFPEFLNFKEGLNLIEINICASDIDITISLSSKEINPVDTIFSKYIVESNDRIITNGLSDEITSFFKKRKNYHNVVHKYGIYVSIAISYLLYIVIRNILIDICKIEINNEYMLPIFFVLSFPIKKYLRWLFPYVYFVSEDRQRRFQRILMYGILVSLLGRFIFLLMENDVKTFLGKK